MEKKSNHITDISFKEVKSFKDPFSHILVNEVLAPAVAKQVLDWLKETELWEIQNATNHNSLAFNIDLSDVPDNLKGIFSGNTFLKLFKTFEDIFKVSLKETLVLTAFMYKEGGGTTIHTDFETEKINTFTHRFIIYFNDDWTEKDGGALGLFRSESVEDLVKIIPPIHNTGVGMLFSPFSHHAVGAVNSGTRYSLVFSLLSDTKSY
ncbi:2OG-Fe(II) oxygenase [Bacillus sp. 166amftsu]|uniref:2OG-Fe(II) oxygenase n=1 Tax=Bacillus sp. 166amftsu TaxID=1761753 RepID=UPI00089AD1DB|nr:2OG-Fe(II) oxygenase [Bacillus sp. 166amftsu]SDZ40627.1 2OG-Fe(II) oxygenase superfamily protein [Bacillus sp. 166amftsu]